MSFFITLYYNQKILKNDVQDFEKNEGKRLTMTTSDLLVQQYDLLETNYAFIMDMEQKIIWQSARMSELPFIKDSNIAKFNNEDDTLWQYFLKQLQQQQTGDLLLPLQYRNKQIVFHVKGFFHKDLQLFIIIFQIVSETEIRKQEETQQFLNYFRQGLVLTTLDHSIVHFNQYIEKMIPKQIIQSCNTIQLLFEQKIIELKDEEQFFQILNDQKTYTGYCTVAGVQMRLVVYLDEAAKRYIYLFEDVSEILQLKKELSNREYLSEIGEMAATLVHEMRNPMTCIKGYVDIMLSDGNMENNYIPIIERELTHLNQLCSDILFMSKPMSNNIKGVDLLQLVKDVKELMDVEVRGTNISITLSYSDRFNFIVAGNEMYFKQIVMNVVKNAVQAIDGEGVVEIVLHENIHNVQLIVIDTGCGIKKEEVDSIFEMFYTTKSYGTGLGLPVVKKIVEQLNGSIDVKSIEGTGTKITINLPTIH